LDGLDRIGRVKVMCLTILFYSFATALCGVAWSLTSFAVFRFLSGFGIGGEWAAGTPMLQESVPERMRIRLASWLHTATPIGGLLAVGASFLVPLVGWRGVFFLGVLPALLTVWLRRSVPEPKMWQKAAPGAVRVGIGPMFRGPQARTTSAAASMMACIIFGLWSCTFWAPTLIISRLTASGVSMAVAQRSASYSGLMLNGGTLLACGLMPWIATMIGPRRRAATIFFLGSLVSVFAAYIVAGEMVNSVTLFIWLLPPLGFFTKRGVRAVHPVAAGTIPNRAAIIRCGVRLQPGAHSRCCGTNAGGGHRGDHRIVSVGHLGRVGDLFIGPAGYLHGPRDSR
jgi:MFS family permease